MLIRRIKHANTGQQRIQRVHIRRIIQGNALSEATGENVGMFFALGLDDETMAQVTGGDFDTGRTIL